ncbi:MAG TPA: hypothetical protein VH592_07960 [Gemmataceae bacterium]|jgi:hypothetical protein
MADPDLYEAWKRWRSEAPVPDDFADRVMASLRLAEQKPGRRFVHMLRGLLRSPAFRVGICSLACIAGLLRVLQVIVLLFSEQACR